MGRLAGLVIGLEAAAVVVAYLAFGWPMLLVGVPALVGTGFVLLFVRLSEKPRARLQEARAARYEDAPVPGGLMSGFFEVPVPQGAAESDRTRA
ncbi:hypothetical protein ACL02T_16115 [Pseudonocardia sp. RS010]|uniref:hypothetical protein n=1 Tax=Pseudonocardia sp. RS010 TaxID=3385979 RepID=UPI0039A25C5C